MNDLHHFLTNYGSLLLIPAFLWTYRKNITNTAVSFDSKFSAIDGVTITIPPPVWYKPAIADGSIRGLPFAMEQRNSSGRGVPATFLFIFKSDSAPLFTITRKSDTDGLFTSHIGYLADIYPSEILVTSTVNVTTQTKAKIEFDVLQLRVLRRICEAPSFLFIKNDQWTGFQVYFSGWPLEDAAEDHETLARDLTDFTHRSQPISWNGATRFHQSEPPSFMDRIHLYSI